MPRFNVFEAKDLDGKSPVGVVCVAENGAIDPTIDARSPQAARLQRALGEVRSAKSLQLTSEDSRGTGASAARVMKVRDVAPGDALYPWAVAEALSRRHGFRCDPISEGAEARRS